MARTDLYPIAEPQTWCEFECEVPYSSSNRLSQIVEQQPTNCKPIARGIPRFSIPNTSYPSRFLTPRGIESGSSVQRQLLSSHPLTSDNPNKKRVTLDYKQFKSDQIHRIGIAAQSISFQQKKLNLTLQKYPKQSRMLLILSLVFSKLQALRNGLTFPRFLDILSSTNDQSFVLATPVL